MTTLAFIAACSALAATFSAVAAWRMPVSAARLAERMRTDNERKTQERHFKLNVFAEIMQSRAEIYSENSVKALNSIDIAFHKSESVREAWAELYQALNTSSTPAHVVEERLRKLLREMAQEVGLAESLRLDDFGRIYFPTALAEDSHIRTMQRKDHLERLMGQRQEPSSTQQMNEKWPPKPVD